MYPDGDPGYSKNLMGPKMDQDSSDFLMKFQPVVFA